MGRARGLNSDDPAVVGFETPTIPSATQSFNCLNHHCTSYFKNFNKHKCTKHQLPSGETDNAVKDTVCGKIDLTQSILSFVYTCALGWRQARNEDKRHKTRSHWKFQSGKNCPLKPPPRSNMRFPQVSLDGTFNQQTTAGVGKPRRGLENKNSTPYFTL